MDDDFFDAPASSTAQQSSTSGVQFQFDEPAQQQRTFQGLAEQALDPMTEQLRREEEKILQSLRLKAEAQYQQKKARREKGQAQLEEFLAKKQSEKSERHQNNLEEEKKLLAQQKMLNEVAGWKKVAASISLKQGDASSGTRSINRMREAVLNKLTDPSNM